MSPPTAYTPLPHTSSKAADDEDAVLDSLKDVPSNFDLALNSGTNRTFLSPKQADPSGLNPDAPRRLSVSTLSSMGYPHSRSTSPYPVPHVPEESGLKAAGRRFWARNEGLLLVSFSQLFGALMNVTARLLELEGEGMNPLQVLFARMSLTMVFCCGYMWWKKTPHFPLGAKGIRLLLVARGTTGFLGIFGMYYSLQYLPVADATVITFLAPSLASYGCYLFLKEPFPRSAQYASLISLLGVILIARPASFFSFSSSSTTSSHVPSNSTTAASDSSIATSTSAQRLSAVAVAMVGVVGAAFVYTIIRWIGPRAHPLISVNYFAVFCTLVSTVSLTLGQAFHLSPDLHFKLPANRRQWSMLFFLGVCGFIMQFLLTSGLSAGGRGNGARASHMIYTNMLFALALDKLVFGQSPGWWSLAGSGLILGSALFIALKKQQGEQAGGGDEERIIGVHVETGTAEEEMGILRGREEATEEGALTVGNEERIGASEIPMEDLTTRSVYHRQDTSA